MREKKPPEDRKFLGGFRLLSSGKALAQRVPEGCELSCLVNSSTDRTMLMPKYQNPIFGSIGKLRSARQFSEAVEKVKSQKI
jgi:hypothetical protein